MKILIVCSANSNQKSFSLAIHQPFIHEQRNSLIKRGIEADVFLIRGRGLIGYLKNLHLLSQQIDGGLYDLVHAHYGLTGMLCILQRKAPVIISYQGSDVVFPKNNIISSIAGIFAKSTIFVSRALYNKMYIKPRSGYCVIPYGIDLRVFKPINKSNARQSLGLNLNDTYVLFSSSRTRKVKNYALAEKAIKYLDDVNLLEFEKGLSREEVSLLINASDVVLMTSFSEGSPQVIKEAMACNCPIVSTYVGDVKELISDIEGCYKTTYDPKDVAEKIKLALDYGKKTEGRKKIMHLDLDNTAQKIKNIYKKIIHT